MDRLLVKLLNGRGDGSKLMDKYKKDFMIRMYKENYRENLF